MSGPESAARRALPRTAGDLAADLLAHPARTSTTERGTR